ncbi:MAG: type II secretion system GspH family protein [Myxococcota bacterium]|nr:type II secretion system GspH family protein [Myxococcota bacterium]
MRSSSRGFTLLEVLVAIAILGLGLTAILGAQAGLFASATRAEKLTVASNLVRCQMEETERKLIREGLPYLDDTEEGDCCDDEGDTIDGYRCETKIERVTLPEPRGMAAEDAGAEDSSGADMGPLGMLAQLQEAQAAPGATGAGSLQDIAQTLGKGAAVDGMGPMVMGMVYPDLKPLLEASIRRVTVTVKWTEGVMNRELPVTQFVAYPQMGGLDETDAGLPEVPEQ